MKCKLFFLISAMLACQLCLAQDWKVFPYKPAGSLISFPADQGRHSSEPIEWWYTSGHLTGATSGKTYSFMLTYFYYPATSFDGFRILNISDDASGKFYEDTKPVNYTTLAQDHLDIQAKVFEGGTDFWSNKTDAANKLLPFEYSIKASSSIASLNLNSAGLKRPLIVAGDGKLPQGKDNYTYYYSETRNELTGTLSLNGVTENVTGVSWIDRQYGNFNPLTGENYEWFHMQLSNGMDVNLWNIFTDNNTIPDNEEYRIFSAYVNETTQYTTSDFKIERLGYNIMADSGMSYAGKWRVTSDKNKVDVIISTVHNNTEVTWPFRFFEGATTIAGTVNGTQVTGAGFAELLHHYENPLVSLKVPDGGAYDPAQPVFWQLLNPDEGRPVTYDLEYSINDKLTFNPVATAITDTFFTWKDANLTGGEKIWFKITGRSVDGKLTGSVISKNASSVTLKNSEPALQIYPNPVDNYLFFQPAFSLDNPVCKILDVNCRVLKVFPANSLSNKIDVSVLQKGIYFLQVGFADKKSVLKFFKK